MEFKPLIFDIGSYKTRVGFQSEDPPEFTFRTVIKKTENQEFLIGENALKENQKEDLICPVQKRLIVDWEAFEEILKYTYDKLINQNKTDFPVFFIESCLNPKRKREKIAEIFFETFNSTHFFFSNQNFLSLLSTGNTSGIILDSGESVSHVVSVYKGLTLRQTAIKLDFGGEQVDLYLKQLLFQNGFHLDSFQSNLLKHDKCFVKNNFQIDVEKEKEELYEFPDGKVVKIGKEKHLCTEILFNPKLFGIDSFGINFFYFLFIFYYFFIFEDLLKLLLNQD